MLEFAHVLTGGVIAYKLNNPLVSLPFSFFSHFLLDLLPHWNPHLSTEKKKYGQITRKTFLFILGDSFLGLLGGLFWAFKALPNLSRVAIILTGCFLSILPDLIEAPYYFLNYNKPWLKKLIVFQNRHQFNIPFLPGILSQIFFILLLILLADSQF